MITKTESPNGALKTAVAGIASTGFASGKMISARTNIPGRKSCSAFSNFARNRTLRVSASRSGLIAANSPSKELLG